MELTDFNNRVELRRYGVLGGTFDPIHNGHLFIAQTALEELQLNKVLFIPNRISPFKEGEAVTEPHHRGTMTEIAILDNENFSMSPMEIYRKGPSYTIETIRQLIIENPPNTAFYFILGTDAFSEIEGWKDYQQLLSLINLVVVTRGGFDSSDLDKKIEYFTKVQKGHIMKLTIPTLEISSTDIRNLIRGGKSIKYMVPQGVESYIRKHGLYKA